MFIESKPLEGKPDKYVNGYDLTGVGKYDNMDTQQDIIDFLVTRSDLYNDRLKEEKDEKLILEKSNKIKDKETLENIITRSIPGYEDLIKFIDDQLIPYFRRPNLIALDILFNEINNQDTNKMKLARIAEYYFGGKNHEDIAEWYSNPENTTILYTDDIGMDNRTILNNIQYDTIKTIRQNDPLKNEAGAKNELKFSNVLLNNPTTTIPIEPYFETKKKYNPYDFADKDGNIFEVKSVFKTTEKGRTYDNYIFYVPKDKIEKLEEYKRAHPNNIVRIYWYTYEGKPSKFIAEYKDITRGDYLKNMYYIDIQPNNTLSQFPTVSKQSSSGVNQESYQLGEERVDFFADKKDPSRVIQPQFYMNRNTVLDSLSKKERDDVNLLTPEEQKEYIDDHFLDRVQHWSALRIALKVKNEYEAKKEIERRRENNIINNIPINNKQQSKKGTKKVTYKTKTKIKKIKT
jgi:hypothetical protein